MPVHAMKPTLKAPGIKLLRLKNDDVLTFFAFKSNLRRYKEVLKSAPSVLVVGGGTVGVELAAEIAGLWGRAKAVTLVASQAGAYTRPLFSST